MELRTILLFGRSGSGKGKQGGLLKNYLETHDSGQKVLYVETGRAFREFAARDNYTSHLSQTVLREGGLQPDFLPIWIWTQFFVDNYTGTEHIITDGLARREHEAPVLDSAFRFYNRTNPDVLHINVSREWAVERLLARARADDTIDEINKRLNWFDEYVEKSLEYFKGMGNYYRFHEINGEQSIEEVHQEIISKLF